MSRVKSLKLGTLIRFIRTSEDTLMPGWIDEFDNIIPESTMGMIVSKKYKKLTDFVGWEYDILISTLGIVSPNWGEFAFEVLE